MTPSLAAFSFALLFPRKTSLAEMTVNTDLVVVYIQQSQSLDDTLRSQVIAVMDIGFDEVQRLILCAKALDRHPHRLNHAAHATDATVGIARQLPVSHTTVGVAAAQHETAGRIDELRKVAVQT